MKSFFHESRNKLYLAFYNLSSYLPLSIPYAETVGTECDIVQYNKDYYTAVGLVLAGILALVGVLFAFFGKNQFSILSINHIILCSYLCYIAINGLLPVLCIL